jgi:hypothetical protein
VLRLGRVYKQLLGSDGRFAELTLAASTSALAGGDRHYSRIEAALSALDALRNRVTARMSNALLGAAFAGRRVDPHQARDLVARGHALIRAARALAR